MIVIDVEWSDNPCLVHDETPYCLRLIYDTSFGELSEKEQMKIAHKDWLKFVGQKVEVFLYKVSKHNVSSNCIAYHGLNTDSNLQLLRFGYFKNDEKEEIVISNRS